MRFSFSLFAVLSVAVPGVAFAQAAPAPAPAVPAPAPPSTVGPAAAAPGAGAAAEDRDTPEAAADPSKDVPFYHPSGPELGMAPPAPNVVPWMFSLLQTSDYFAVGSVRGMGEETRLRIGKSTGFSLGTYNFNTFGAGVDFFRYAGVQLVAAGPNSPVAIFLLVPNLDFRFYVGDTRGGAALGTSVTGLRVANCALTGCFEASLRIATLDVWAATDFKNASAAFSVGGNLSVGIKL